MNNPDQFLLDVRTPEAFMGERVSPKWMKIDHGKNERAISRVLNTFIMLNSYMKTKHLTHQRNSVNHFTGEELPLIRRSFSTSG